MKFKWVPAFIRLPSLCKQYETKRSNIVFLWCFNNDDYIDHYSVGYFDYETKQWLHLENNLNSPVQYWSHIPRTVG